MDLAHLVWGAEALCTASGLELPQEGNAEVSPTEVFDRLDVPEPKREAVIAEVGAIGEKARQFTH